MWAWKALSRTIGEEGWGGEGIVCSGPTSVNWYQSFRSLAEGGKSHHSSSSPQCGLMVISAAWDFEKAACTCGLQPFPSPLHADNDTAVISPRHHNEYGLIRCEDECWQVYVHGPWLLIAVIVKRCILGSFGSICQSGFASYLVSEASPDHCSVQSAVRVLISLLTTQAASQENNWWPQTASFLDSRKLLNLIQLWAGCPVDLWDALRNSGLVLDVFGSHGLG